MNIDIIFENNKRWVFKKLQIDTDYFKNLYLEKGHEILYIGFSDSLVTTEKLMGVNHVEVFVHRNIAKTKG